MCRVLLIANELSDGSYKILKKISLPEPNGKTLDQYWLSTAQFSFEAFRKELVRLGTINENYIWIPELRGGKPSWNIKVLGCWEALVHFHCVSHEISLAKVCQLFNNTFSTQLNERRSLHGLDKSKDMAREFSRFNDYFSALALFNAKTCAKA
jgi:hypothetical protein